jgi:hypothetical protein
MANADKVMIGNSGDWVRVRKDVEATNLAIGEDGEVISSISMRQWETFEVIRKLADVSGLYSDRTGAMGLIIRRPENPAEAERREELAYKFMDTSYEECIPAMQHAILFIVEGEIKRGEL